MDYCEFVLGGTFAALEHAHAIDGTELVLPTPSTHMDLKAAINGLIMVLPWAAVTAIRAASQQGGRRPSIPAGSAFNGAIPSASHSGFHGAQQPASQHSPFASPQSANPPSRTASGNLGGAQLGAAPWLQLCVFNLVPSR